MRYNFVLYIFYVIIILFSIIIMITAISENYNDNKNTILACIFVVFFSSLVYLFFGFEDGNNSNENERILVNDGL